MTSPETYLKKSPTKFSIILSFNRKPDVSDDAIKQAVASLMNYFSSSKQVPGNINTLIAINPALIGYPSKTELLPRSSDHATMPSTQNDAMILASCENVNDTIFVQRVCKNALATTADITECISGSRLRFGQEPFGFYHPEKGKKVNDGIAIINDGELKGGSWVLAQRYVQHVDTFYQLPRSKRDDVMGAEQVGEDYNPTPTFPESAHTNIAQAGSRKPLMARRGFTYNANGDEGTYFIGMSESTDFFSQTLNAMLEHDALLGYTQAVTGGIYYAPPSGDFLDENAPAINTPDSAKALVLLDKDSGDAWPLVDYTVIASLLAYLDLLRDGGLFIGPVGNMDINPDVQTMLTASHQILAGGSIKTKPLVEGYNEDKVKAMQHELDKTGNGSSQLNLLTKYYVTLE